MLDPGSSLIRRKRRRDGPVWFMLSVLLHVTVILALIFLTPLREVLFEADPQLKQELTMAAHEIERVAEQIEQINREWLEENVEALEHLTEEMEQTKAEQYETFAVFEKQQIETAPQAVSQKLEQALAAMEAAEASIKSDNRRETDRQQALADSLQQESAALLDMIDPSGELAEVQESANAAQQEAIEAQAQHKAEAHALNDARRKAERAQKDLATQEKRLANAVKKQHSLAGQTRDAETRAEKADGAVKAEEAKENTNAKRLRQLTANLRKAQTEHEKRQKRHDEAVKQAEKLSEKVDTLTKQIEDLERSAKEQAEPVEATKQEAIKKQAEARAQQEAAAKKIEDQAKRKAEQLLMAAAEAAQEQTQAEEAREQTAATDEASAPRAIELPSRETVFPEKQPPADRSEMGVLELYAAALELEKRLTEDYRVTRAMKLATVQDVPLEQAMQAIDRVTPVRPPLDVEALTSKVQTDEQLARQKEQVASALDQTASMISLANLLIMQAQAEAAEGDGEGDGSAISLAAIQARSAAMQNLEALASQQASGQSVDVAEAMRGAAAKGASAGRSESELEFPQDEEEAGGAEWVDVPPQIGKGVRPVMARQVASAGGEPAQWIALDDWYTLGPFANPARANIDRKFPPESFVDLDATYVGKQGQTIRWEFTGVLGDRGQVTPPNAEPYGIWYAYTEVYFDQPRDAWIAMGSDDKGRLWINDLPVWVSIDSHKNWTPGEALRRVHFKQGVNRILFRCENGWRGMAFSLWIRLPDGSPKS